MMTEGEIAERERVQEGRKGPAGVQRSMLDRDQRFWRALGRQIRRGAGVRPNARRS